MRLGKACVGIRLNEAKPLGSCLDGVSAFGASVSCGLGVEAESPLEAAVPKSLGLAWCARGLLAAVLVFSAVGTLAAKKSAAPYPPDYTGVCFEQDFEAVPESEHWRYLSDTDERSTIRVVTAADGVPLREGGHALSIEGENKWNAATITLPRPIPLTHEVFLRCVFWTSGTADTIGVNVAADSKPSTHHKLGPASVQRHGDGWGVALWRLNDYFPRQQYRDPESSVVTGIRFVQRVSGGHEKPDGGDFHQLVVDDLLITSGRGVDLIRTSLVELGEPHVYDGAQCFQVGEFAAVNVWHAPSVVKVREEQAVPERRSAAVAVSAARNESESFQLVFRSSEPMHGLTIVPGELRGPDGACIPATAVRWHPVFYLPIRARYFGVACDQRWPGPLSWNRQFSLRSGINQLIWFTVHVPKGIQAGQYRGGVSVRQNDRSLVDIPVQFDVWDFDFPDRVTFRTNIQVWNNVPNPWDKRTKWEGMEDAARLLAMYHMSDASTFPRYPKALQEELVARYGVNTVKLPFCGGHQGGVNKKVTKLKGHGARTAEYEAAFSEFINTRAERLKSLGVWPDCFLYVWDEPWGDFEVVELIQYIARLSKVHFADLKTLVAAPYYPEFDDCIDIFLAGYTEPGTRNAALAKGKSFWWWANSETYIDLPGIDARMGFGFKSIKQGISGAYAWGVFVLRQNSRKVSVDPPDPDWPHTDPWQMCVRANYAADVIWPGGRAESEPERLVPSVALELLRDGIEDYEYYMMLKVRLADAAGREDGQALARLRALIERCERLYEAPCGVRSDFGLVDRLAGLRAEIAGELLR